MVSVSLSPARAKKWTWEPGYVQKIIRTLISLKFGLLFLLLLMIFDLWEKDNFVGKEFKMILYYNVIFPVM